MEQIKKIWSGASDIPGANWIIGIAGLIISILVAYYFVKLFRDMALGRATTEPADIMSEFRRLRDEGTLGEEEYKKLANAAKESPEVQQPEQTKDPGAGPIFDPVAPEANDTDK